MLIALMLGLSTIQHADAAGPLRVWDSSTPFGDTIDISKTAGWKIVPADLLTLEKDPAKASSDPGYYGRTYEFKGDAVVESETTVAVFWSAKGRVEFYARRAGGGKAPLAAKRVFAFAPKELTSPGATITHCEIVRNAGDDIQVEAFFSSEGAKEIPAAFTFDKAGIITVRPDAGMKGVRLTALLEYGVAAGFIGDDLILNAADYSSSQRISVPSENLFLGLVAGEENVLVMSWPKGKQRMQLEAAQQTDRNLFGSIDLDNAGQSFCLGILSTPGIWHKETLKPSFLEKDVALSWKRPFPAKWKTQLSEAGVRTTFNFREVKGQVWRGVPGSYSYPVWFDGDTASYHLSKKVPPQGDSIVYFVEGQNTPPSITAPADILKATLGRPASEAILDYEGRQLRTHHRRGDAGVHRACTCGCTEAIQAVFEAGEEVTRKEYIQGAIDDMIFFVQNHVARIDEYRRFSDDTIKYLKTQEQNSPELKAYCENLEQIIQQIPDQYEVQKENMKSLQFAAELSNRTIALTAKKESTNLKTYMDLLKTWRAMGGAQDYVVAFCHTIGRKLGQEAGYSCATMPAAVTVAEEIRARCRQILRHPDGYEIWADY